MHFTNCPLYLINTFLCFVSRRKRIGKGAKRRARSGGRAQQKGSKLQGKAAQPSPAPKPSITEGNQSEQRKRADEPDGVPPSARESTDCSRKISAGLKSDANVSITPRKILYVTIVSPQQTKKPNLCLSAMANQARPYLTTLMRRRSQERRVPTNQMVHRKSRRC